MKKSILTICLCVLAAFLTAPAGATTRTWDGETDNEWWTNANWNPNGTPSSSDELTINSGSPTTIDTVITADGGSITFNNSGTTGSFVGLYTGYFGTGTLDITNGADVTSSASLIGYSTGSTGTATVDGSGSTWNTGGNYLYVGREDGTGTLNITNGADVTSGTGSIGTNTGSTGTVTVDGDGSTWDTGIDNLYVGAGGTGTLNISNGADVTSGRSYIGNNSSSTGTATVDGFGSTWDTGTGSMYVGNSGTGTLNITNSADVTSGEGSIGHESGSEGTVIVDGSGSTWDTGTSCMYVGDSGTGTLNITNGADVTSDTGYIGRYSGSTGTATVDGSGSTWDTGTDSMYVGNSGTGTLNITNGADVTSGEGYIGHEAGSDGTVTVDGYGSSWDTGSDDLYVGYDDYATATLNVSNDAQVTTGGNFVIGDRGTVNLSGGKLSVKYLSGSPDTPMNFTGGELEITTGHAFISGTSPLGSYLSMTSGQVLDVQNGTTTVASGAILNVNNGTVYSDELQNDGSLSIGNGGLVNTASGLTNSSSMSMSGGMIAGPGTVTNDYGASFSAKGTVNHALNNYGTINLDDVLTVNGEMDNYGSVNISTSEMLRQNGGLDNYGTVDLDGGSISGSGTVTNHPGGIIRGGSAIGSQITNDGGLIHADGDSTLLISDMTDNINGGEMRVDDGAGINVLTPLFNDGTIVLNGSNATFSGDTILNTGTILGQGWFSNSVDNDGTVRASGGTLTLAGSDFTNNSTGRIEALDDSTVFVTQGMKTNRGDIALQGGSFDNANHNITNNSSITGYGTFRSGGLTNKSHIGVGGGDLEVIGSVINDGTCDIQAGSTAVFFDDVSGSGTFGGNGTAMFLDVISPGSSPGTMIFDTNVILGSGSTLIMELGGLIRGDEYDAFDVAGDFFLDGILNIALIDDFVPQFGNMFDILDFEPANLFGEFDTIGLPALPTGLEWDTSSLYSFGEIGVIPEPATITLLTFGWIVLFRRKTT